MTDLDGIAVLAPDVPAGQAGHQRAGAKRRARGHAVLGRRRLAARDLRGRRQPRRRPHRGHAAGPRPAARRARPLRHAVARHALRRRDRPRASASPRCWRSAFPTRRLLRAARHAGIGGRGLQACAREVAGPGPNRPAACTAVYNVGPGSHGVSRALQELGYDSSLGFVVHDLLEVHRSMLVANALSYVLHQDVHYAVMTAAKVLRAAVRRRARRAGREQPAHRDPHCGEPGMTAARRGDHNRPNTPTGTQR